MSETPILERAQRFLSALPHCRLLGISTHAADASGLLHLLIGLGIAFRPTARIALAISLPVILIYIACGSLMRIGLWLDPLGALIKMIPILALTLVALAIWDDR